MLPSWDSSVMTLRCAAIFIEPLSSRSPDNTIVATRPAIMPFIEFDIVILPDQKFASTQRLIVTGGNCGPLSQGLHLEPQRDFGKPCSPSNQPPGTARR